MDKNRNVTRANRGVAAEASLWFAEFRDGSVPQTVRLRFAEWLRRSPDHVQAYLEISAAWSELPTSDPEGRIDIEALIARTCTADENLVIAFGAEDAVNRQEREDAPGASKSCPCARASWRLSGRPRRHYSLAAAAAFLGVLVVAGFATWFALFRADTYSTGIGEQRTLMLTDGSTIELNALSRVKVRLSTNVRSIELTEGQALFRVAKDRTRPFVVRSTDAIVRAVGTQFDVYQKNSGTTVTVLEGQVAVLPKEPAGADSAEPNAIEAVNAASILLAAGQQVTVTPRQISQPKKADVASTTSWTEHRLIFEATSLAEVADEFNRYNRRKLVIEDAVLRRVEISGVYSSADPESLLGFLRAQSNLAVTETDTEVRVTRRVPSDRAGGGTDPHF